MNFYVPLFSKIVDSSLWCEPDFVVKVFLTMIAKKDRDNVVRGSAFNIAQWSKKTEAEVLEALKILSSPDTRRLEPQPYDGRRIEKREGGWFIVNGKYYQDLMVQANTRARNARGQAALRERLKASPPEYSTTHIPSIKFTKPTLEEVKLAAAKAGLPMIEAEKIFAHYESNGWMVGKNKMKNLGAAVSGWKLRNYDDKGNPKVQVGGRNNERRFDRNKGTFNEGHTEEYDTERIQAARELREQQRRAAQDAGSSDPVRSEP